VTSRNSPSTRAGVDGDSVDGIITLAKQRFDHVRGLISPRGLLDLARLTLRLRGGRYHTVVLLHHLTTEFGASKFRALVRATGAKTVAGLDNGRGSFLTHRATDYGFGVKPEWQYGLDVVETLTGTATIEQPRLSIPTGVEHSARQLLARSGVADKYAVLHPEVGEFSPARAWPDRHFVETASAIASELRLPVVLVGTEAHRPGTVEISRIDGVHNFVGNTSFPELCAIVRDANLVVGCDSSVSHLAGAFGRPAITLFGPSNIGAWMPYGATIRELGSPLVGSVGPVALHLNMPCSPCLYTGFRLGRPQGCRSRACMTGLKPASVIDLASGLLEASGGTTDTGRSTRDNEPHQAH
jgi:ADP-heptose:LPS heptosyltransferase